MAANDRIRPYRLFAPVLGAALLLAGIGPAFAQIEPDRCPRLVSPLPDHAKPVSLRLAQAETNEVRLTYIGHSTFLIQSPGGIRIATDYNDYVRPDAIPDVATMNRAHSTHYTNFPDPMIKHVLRGWGESGAAAKHEITIGDVWVRNVPTNIRDWAGGTINDGNSIFVFEVAGLCIAHLGHLHHTLTPAHLDALGRIDVVLVPVDGSFTLNMDGMVEVLKQIDARLAIPMHVFSEFTLSRFLEKMGSIYSVERHPTPTLILSRKLLPRERTLVVLPGR
jgi:L-ascorbate metabolism protein UlaG (beta-lactamase superfamily)